MAHLNAIIPISLIGGTAAIAGGTYFFYGSSLEPTKILFKEKFKHALLSTFDSKDDSLWASKWGALKGLSKVKNAKLSKALTDHKTKSIDDDIRSLIKDGCREIYESEFEGEDSESYSDFKNVCSRSVKDKIGGTWLANDDGKIGEKWTAISNSPIESLTSELRVIKAKDEISGKAKLKEWCDAIAIFPYNGDDTLLTNNATSYCRVSN